MKITVEVTQKFIDMGEVANCWSCAVALAISHIIGQPVHVCYQRVSLGGDGKSRKLPMEAVRFIRTIDGGHPVSPITFDLDVPDEWMVTK